MSCIRVASRGFQDLRAGLADPDRQWREGYSAQELAQGWNGRNDFPPAVRSVFSTSPLLADAELLLGLPEYRVRLSGRGHGSQVDLLALARSGDGYSGPIAIAVEGKVGEFFDPTVGA